MDLRSIINTDGTDNSASKAAQTPVNQARPTLSMREYSESSQGSIERFPSQDFRPKSISQSPIAYQGGFPNRPPPQLSAHSSQQHNDLRSPVSQAYASQSPYPHTPSSAVAGSQYSLPQSQPANSSVQLNSYPATHQRESFTESRTVPHLQNQNSSYSQSSPVPQTPPVITPGSANPYVYPRSQSSHSNSTPTSAQGQQNYFGPNHLESPVSAGSHPLVQHSQRLPSHPGTPLGPPISNNRTSSAGYARPTSPYQQRPPSSGAFSAQHHQRGSPIVAGAQPVSTNTASVSDTHRPSVASEYSTRSHSEREQSMSVSPKTQPQSHPREDIARAQAQDSSNGHSAPLKRKREDRVPSANFDTGSYTNGEDTGRSASTSSGVPVKKMKKRYFQPPIWAQSARGLPRANDPLARKQQRPVARINGAQFSHGPPPGQTNAQGNPPTLNGHARVAPPAINQSTPALQKEDKWNGLLGPWEQSILGTQPYEELSKQVADWLFVKVVSRADATDLASKGVAIEIEAKLGKLINKETNERFYLPISSEALLPETGRVGFQSSMTEKQHKNLNDFLNTQVTNVAGANQQSPKSRVPIEYKHRREQDTFYELPATAFQTLPASIQGVLNPRHTIKVRVTHDQKTNKLLASIIKARIADLDLYSPHLPLDCRLSINLEMQYQGDIEALIAAEGPRLPERNKDRLSYTQSHYQIDLTQVTSADVSGKVEKTHELEVEVSTSAILEQGRAAFSSQPHKYPELVQGFIDNVRVLARRVGDP